MRIISDFHDYYDSAMGYGVDYDSIWLRKPKKLERGIGFASCSSRTWGATKLDLKYESHTVGFCGKVYGLIKLKKLNSDDEVVSSVICYNIDEVDAFVEANSKKKQLEYYNSKQGGWWWRGRFRGLNFEAKRADFAKYFKKFEEERDKHEKFFLDNNTPIFVNRTINASLKKLEFYRIMDPYTAYQEIQMFFGRLRFEERPIPKISNSDMIEAKGFDLKSSFRKDPGGKKRKRKNKNK